uniref:Uncharacterized protein n=1 Tax=Chenopodium quinoa TaxID=63459 RepID=A0A803MU13_CHEQI
MTLLWYAYAKTLGEKAAWEVAKESGLDLVAVNPSFVVGPLLTSQPTSTLELILSLTKASSLDMDCDTNLFGDQYGDVWRIALLNTKEKLQNEFANWIVLLEKHLLVTSRYPKQVIGFVHIDDVIAAHILAMEETKASGRLICSSAFAHWSDIMKMLKDKYPMYPFESKQGSTEGNDFPHSMDTSKIMQLGFPGFKSIPQMFDDCIQSFQDKGFL